MMKLKDGQDKCLQAHWWVWSVFALSLLIAIVWAQGWSEAMILDWDETRRILIRTILYGVAIILFPLTNLLRHVLLRLDQTMPGSKPAAQRYFSTVLTCLLLIETVAGFGVAMRIVGDELNTFYIFMVLGGLGLFLHRPKLEELAVIEQVLANRTN